MCTILGTTIQERYEGIRECAKEGSTWEDSCAGPGAGLWWSMGVSSSSGYSMNLC